MSSKEQSLCVRSRITLWSAKTGPDFLSYLVFYEGKLINAPAKPEDFQQEEATRVYISDMFGSLFRLGASRGVSQIGD